MVETLIYNGEVVTAQGRTTADIAVEDGTVAEVGTSLDVDAAEEIGASGKLVMPGVIDPHVHVEWPD